MDFVWSRQLGKARVSVISDGTGWWLIERAFPDVPEDELRQFMELDAKTRFKQGFNVAHVALPGTSILLDSGFGEYGTPEQVGAILAVQDIEFTPGVIAGLATLGVRPQDVTHVLISHTHGDHVTGATKTAGGRKLPAFPTARCYAMAVEWLAPPDWHQGVEAIEREKAALDAAGVMELVDGEREIVPGVRFIPAPGESPGFAITRVDAGPEVVYYVGELFNHPAEFAHPEWIRRYRDCETLLATRQRCLARFADERALVIMSHYHFPSIGRVERSGGGYRWVPYDG